MRPDYLVISAWGPYKDREEIDFTKFHGAGLFLITGATGAGKTTVFDAMTYALYGALSGQMREKGSVRSDFAAGETPTFVELTMHHGGKEYRIYRNPEYLRPKKKRGGNSEMTREKENAILYLPEGGVVEGVREVNAKMQEILVLDYQQFKQISMIAQGEFSRMLTATAREKIGIFREIFGTGMCDKFMQILRSRSGELYQKAMEQRHKLEEDVRLLQIRSEGKWQEELGRLTEKENWDLECLGQLLREWQQELAEQLTESGERYLELDRLTQEMAGRLTAYREHNRKLSQWQETCSKWEELENRKEENQQREEELKAAKAAASVSAAELTYKACLERREENVQYRQRLAREQEELRQEQAQLRKYHENRATLQKGLELEEELCQLKKEAEQCAQKAGELNKRHGEALEAYLKLEGLRDTDRLAYEEADRSYRRTLIGFIAGQLKEQEPCPVCGSREHPSPAGVTPGAVTEEKLKELRVKLRRSEQILADQQGKTAELRALSQEGKERLERLEAQREKQEKEQNERKEILREKGIELVGLNRAALGKYLQRFDHMDGLLVSKEQDGRRAEQEGVTLEGTILDTKEAFCLALRGAGFAGEEDYRRALRTPQQCTELERKIREYQEAVAGTLGLKEHLERELQSREHVDETALAEQLASLQEQKEQLRESREHLASLRDGVERTVISIDEKQEKLERISREYGYVKDLDNLASGNNSRRLVFEQYVLMGYFKEVLRAANLRFARMTGGRYEMSCVEEAGDGRSKDSLEIQVMDYYTGKVRSVKTLSGGESFKASLSLALGLSDVIQAASGGIRVEALFVDEGFGALDSESLDQACGALHSLVEQDHMIGIISHVQELRERLDRQIVIEKTNGGSMVKIVV